jgi:hypothetical protein
LLYDYSTYWNCPSLTTDYWDRDLRKNEERRDGNYVYALTKLFA